MLLGHGIDVVSLPSFQRILTCHEADFFSRTFQESEIALFPRGATRLEHIAGRFATKEAILKALGVGYGNGVSFKDIVVNRSDGDPPSVFLSGGAENAAKKIGITDWKISISHTEDLVVASVIACGDRIT